MDLLRSLSSIMDISPSYNERSTRSSKILSIISHGQSHSQFPIAGFDPFFSG
jgi:hypothetical protein